MQGCWRGKSLTLILCKGTSFRSIIFCEVANTNFIQKRSDRANSRSEGANSRSINFCELTLDTNFIQKRSDRANPRSEGANPRSINFCELTLNLRVITLGLRMLTVDLLIFVS